MSTQNTITPHIFLLRHGETEWSESGKSTGRTDIELTPKGIQQVRWMKEKFVGPGQILNPPRIARVYVSPSKRARQTYDLLQFPLSSIAKVIYTDDILEWDYGHYEGLKKDDIKTLRKQRGLDLEREWDLWRDGCEGGESVEDITKRLDRIISEVRSFQGDCMDGHGPGDVLVVAHGAVLRCFVKRFLGLQVHSPPRLMMEPATVTILSYSDGDINKPALHVGLPASTSQVDLPVAH